MNEWMNNCAIIYIENKCIIIIIMCISNKNKINVRKSEKYAKNVNVIKSQIFIRRVLLYCIKNNNFQIFLFWLSVRLLIIGIKSRKTRMNEWTNEWMNEWAWVE